MPHPNRPRPSQLHHHQTHGAEPDAQSARHGLLTTQAKGRRMGRGLPRQPHHSIICSPDSPDLALIKQGVAVWNDWRAAHPKTRPDLLGAPLFGANLCGANLREADLRGADLSYANLCGADLSYANLRGADLLGAALGEADLTKANLGYANLRGTDLSARDLTPSGLALIAHAARKAPSPFLSV